MSDQNQSTITYRSKGQLFDPKQAAYYAPALGGQQRYQNLGQQAHQGDYFTTGLDRKRSARGLDMLEAQARGDYGSIAQQAAHRALAQGQSAIASQAASAPGGYNPAAMRTAQYATQDMAQQVAGKASLAAAQERLAAQQAFARAAANQYQQSGRMELGRGALQQRYEGMGASREEADRQARLAMNRMLLQKYLTDRQIGLGELKSARERDARMFGATMQGIGQMAGAAGQMIPKL